MFCISSTKAGSSLRSSWNLFFNDQNDRSGPCDSRLNMVVTVSQGWLGCWSRSDMIRRFSANVHLENLEPGFRGVMSDLR